MTSTVPLGRSLSISLPRHFVPGYYHAVPPGQNHHPRGLCLVNAHGSASLAPEWLALSFLRLHTNDLTLTRNKGLFGSSFLGRFLDSSDLLSNGENYLSATEKTASQT